MTHNDIVGTTYLSMSKISAPGGELEGKAETCPWGCSGSTGVHALGSVVGVRFGETLHCSHDESSSSSSKNPTNITWHGCRVDLESGPLGSSLLHS